MTKTLTEQFLYGQLLDGYWYINIDGSEDILEADRGKYYIAGALVARAFMGDKIDKIEVLAPVSTYDEHVELLEKIDKLEKELSDAKEYCDYSITNREQLTKQRNYWMDKSDKLEKKLAIAMEALDAVSGDYNEAENLGYYFRKIEEVK